MNPIPRPWPRFRVGLFFDLAFPSNLPHRFAALAAGHQRRGRWQALTVLTLVLSVILVVKRSPIDGGLPISG
jgi:hypothetical protein